MSKGRRRRGREGMSRWGAAAPAPEGRRRRKLRGVAVALALALLAAGGAVLWRSLRKPVLDLHGRRPSIVLITLDTTRADRLGCYGGTVAETPNLDQLASEGVLFEKAISPVPLTLPSHSSMMTGLYPYQHGVHQNGFYALPEKLTTVAEVLSAGGWRTGAFVGSIIVLRRFGLAQGFQTYDDPFHLRTGAMRIDERPAEKVIESARSWLGQVGSDPFFLWVHLYDAHAPYVPPDLFLRRYESHRYEGQIAYMDWALGPLLRELKGRSGPTVIVVAGDHGESLGEHDEATHGFYVYDSVQRVPLFVWAPALFPGGRRVAEPVGLVSLHRTLLELAGADLGAAQEGAAPSLVPALLGAEQRPEDQVLESETAMEQFGTGPIHALRTARWKWIDTPMPELYDLAADPQEQHNVVEQNVRVAAELKQRLARRLEEAPAEEGAGEVHLEPALRETLESLGYVAARSKSKAADPKLDPKQVAPLLKRMQAGREALMRHDGRKAYEIYDEVIHACRTARSAMLHRGNAAVMAGDYELASRSFQEASEVFPDEPMAFYNLGVALMALKQPEPARKALERALELDPADADVHYALGVTCLANRDTKAGREHLENYLKLAPNERDSAEARQLLEGLAKESQKQ
jgi:arylsulfatase A-like enzyme/Tfp pilus assembly protein PilF